MKTISPTGGNGALYGVHCQSWTIAKQMLGIQGNVMRCDIDQELLKTSPISLFRAKRQYRTDAANQLRRLVAFRMRSNRELARP